LFPLGNFLFVNFADRPRKGTIRDLDGEHIPTFVIIL
jgi:hypothetical protein